MVKVEEGWLNAPTIKITSSNLQIYNFRQFSKKKVFDLTWQNGSVKDELLIIVIIINLKFLSSECSL